MDWLILYIFSKYIYIKKLYNLFKFINYSNEKTYIELRNLLTNYLANYLIK